MREVPPIMTARWVSGQYIGDAKPIARVTVQRPNIELQRTQENLFTTLMFGGGDVPLELPNVKSVEWDRDVDVDVANCTLQFYNTEPLPLGEKVGRDLDQPGYFTYNRGSGTIYAPYWDHVPNEWSGMLMPDNVIRTFEGYGFDPDSVPELDPNLVQTGVWMIDEVEYTHDGLITVRCRDVGRMLIDQICFPPVNPFQAGFIDQTEPPQGPIYPDGAYAYPVGFTGVNSEPIFNEVPVATQGLSVTPNDSSNSFYTSGAVYGHVLRDAFDSDDSTYWLSIGNARPDQGYSFEWLQGRVQNSRVRRVRFKSWKAGHTAYLSVYANGQWQGSQTIPYDPDHPASAPNDSNRPFVAATAVTGTGWTEFNLPGEGIENATLVRITFGNLQDSGLGQFQFRAGCRRFEVYGIGGSGELTETEVIELFDQNYSDYTDIVKLFCAWGGFFWPRDVAFQVGDAPDDENWLGSAELVDQRLRDIWDNRDLGAYDEAYIEMWVQRIFVDETHTLGQARTDIDFLASNQGAEELLSGGFKRFWPFVSDDPAMTIRFGRVWGDFQQSGTAGPASIPPSVFDKKPLMDGISYVRDILGFLFYIDETGGVVFRAPNIYRKGNLLRSIGIRSGSYTRNMLSLDERVTLMGLTATIASTNVRERVFVSGTTGEVGHMAAGWNPNPIGLRRMAGWTDQHFETPEECLVMAEMIALRQLFTYRRNSITISGYPGLQIDDQVQVFERVTSEGFVHYVGGIRSSLDHESGEYTYTLSTHWLGENPFETWAFDPAQLSQETRTFLEGLYGGQSMAASVSGSVTT